MIAYLDMPSGISGDMFLGCLVDAGWPLSSLQGIIRSLHLPEDACSVTAERVMRGPLQATLVQVRGTESAHHRHLSDVVAILEQADLPGAVRSRAVATFTRLAEAEAAVHGMPVEAVHFHEVGAIDAIVDVVGTVAGLHDLGVARLYASPAPLGHGWAQTQHGRIPLPAPATLALLAAAGAPTRPAPGPGELVTPTGAALLAELATFSQPPLRLSRIGSGAGQKSFDWPNVARLWLGSPIEGGSIVQMDTNIDDMNPELYPEVVQRLLDAGALDVWTTPIQMKKARPATQLSVLCPAAREADLADLLLRESTTLGVRVHPVHRHEAERSVATVETAYGPIQVKVKWLHGRAIGVKPEYEQCAARAREHGVSVIEVQAAAQAAAHGLLRSMAAKVLLL
jgi:hypothetical protein